MKAYFKLIQITQILLMDLSIAILLILPIIFSFNPEILPSSTVDNLYLISHISLFFVMIVRPLADIFRKVKWIRPLVILRKGTGVLSASIIVVFILTKIIIAPVEYLSAFGTVEYWSLQNFSLFAHLGDITAIILLITSNNLSKRILKSWWKKIQQLSYLYFYSSSLYVFLAYGDEKMAWAISIVTTLTFLAYVINRREKLMGAEIKLQTA